MKKIKKTRKRRKTKNLPLKLKTQERASEKVKPPASGVPVPGANAGSTASMSKVI